MTFTSLRSRFIGVAALVILPMRLAHAASLLPLVSEQAQTLPSGKAEVVAGMAYSDDERFPYFTEPGILRSQTLIHGPQLGFRIGAGDWAEIQASYELIYLDEKAKNGQTNHQYGSGDARLFTKVRVLREGETLPGLGIRFGTKLPNANFKDRLGTDETDFEISALASKDLGLLSLHANMGILLLGDPGSVSGPPRAGKGQDDLFTYSFAAVSEPLGKQIDGSTEVRLMAEAAGVDGSHFHNERHSLRLGIQIGADPVKFYLGASTGLVSGSETIGVQTGFIFAFEPAHLWE